VPAQRIIVAASPSAYSQRYLGRAERPPATAQRVLAIISARTNMFDLPIGSPGVYDVSALQPFVDKLPTEEQRGALVLLFNLVQISRLVDEFAAAVALLDYVEKLRADVEAVQPGDNKPLEIVRIIHALKLWNGMAGRDATMTIFHFGKTLAAIRTSLNGLPSIKDDVEPRSTSARLP
jgi:hypothetical protein